MEQIRIIREMRSVEHRIDGTDQPVRLPRYAVWENVPGAFSSNDGQDFLAVLEEFAKSAEPEIQLPRPAADKTGKIKWNNAGCIDGNGWSLAWRLHDAQYWGVPQRRRRISLVVDFGGNTAAEVLTERESMSGNPKTSSHERESITRNPAESSGESSSDVDSF